MTEPYADLSALDHLFRGDKAQVVQWLRMYLEESPTYFRQLTEGFASADAGAMAHAAHDLCPQAHYLGAPRLLALLEAIEARAKGDGAAACADLVQALSAMNEAINAQVQAAIDKGQDVDKNR